MHMEQKNLEKKNHDLQDQYRNKAKTAQNFKKLYDRIKLQQRAGGLEVAAEHEIEDSLQVAGGRGAPFHSRAGSGHSGNGGGRRQHKLSEYEQRHYGGGGGVGGGDERAGLQSASKSATVCIAALSTDSRIAGSMPQVPATPSNHRTSLPVYVGSGPTHPTGGESLRQGTPRQPLQSVNPNIYGGHYDACGYRGMSAGVKVGRQQNGPMSRSGVAVGMGRPGGMSGYVR